ncbi:MAG: hypothetical protein HY096_01985 [Nitrospinae bacterium]|nr:hypothetical protein [Nitrospinota bacterium]
MQGSGVREIKLCRFLEDNDAAKRLAKDNSGFVSSSSATGKTTIFYYD